MRKWSAVVIAAAVGLAGCSSAGDQEFEQAIRDRAESGSTFRMADAWAGEESWDRFLVICPYTSRDQVAQTIGERWDASDVPDFSGSDSRQALVLLSDDSAQPVAIAELGRGTVDLCGEGMADVTDANATLRASEQVSAIVVTVDQP